MAIDDTIQARFKGVPFFVLTEKHDSGRKVAIHEYPGADVRYVEDLGLLPSIFKITGYVGTTGKDKNKDTQNTSWIQKAKKLSTVLDEDTEGILEMSTFGTVKVKSHVYTKTVRQNSLGVVSFSMTFLVSSPTPSPRKAPVSFGLVAVLARQAAESVKDDFSKKHEVPDLSSTAKTIDYDTVETTKTLADTIRGLGGDIDDITTKATAIRNGVASLIRDPIAFADALFAGDGLLGTIFSTVSATRETLSSLSKLCRVGYKLATDFESIGDRLVTNAIQSFEIPEFASDTRYRTISNRNRKILVNSIRYCIYTTYLDQAVRNEYPTDSDINSTIADINDVYENVVQIADTDPLVALAIDKCRIAALEVLESKLQVTPNIASFVLSSRTVDIELAYRLYAESLETHDNLKDKADTLTDLNGILPTMYEGTIKVLKV